MERPSFLLFAVATALSCVSSRHQDSPELTEALRLQVFEATGRSAWQTVEGAVELAGEADYLGTTAPFSMTLFPDGRYREEVGGPLKKLEIFDGIGVYSSDYSGVMRELSLSSRDQALVLPSLLSGSWLSDSSPFEMTSSEGSFQLSMRSGPTDVRVDLDADAGLPAQYVEGGMAGTVTTTLSDWRLTEDLLMPYSIVVEAGAGGPPTRIRIATVKRVLSAGALTVDMAFPTDVRFDDSIPNQVEVKRVASGHLLVHPLVDGRDVGWFLLDSGAGAMVIDPGVAKELEMELVGEVLATGVGGSEGAGFRAGNEFTLGPMTWEGQVYVEVELGFLEAPFGVPVAGIIGYGFFSRAVVEVEAAAEFVAIYDPSTFDGSGLPWSELLFDGHTPSVMATFDVGDGPLTEPFRMDTGADGTVTFHTPAVKRLELKKGRKLTRTSMGGVGGAGTAFEIKIPWFELAGHRFESPIVTLSQFEVGGFTDEYSTGNIGQDFMSPFLLVFDFAQNRLAFVAR